MTREDALTLMHTSKSVREWNNNRQAVLDSLEKEGDQYTHLIKIPQRLSSPYESKMAHYNFHTVIPKWYFNEINGKAIYTIDKEK